ncbi:MULTISPECIES: magnesium transporter [unclassified Campylobacter]|uniref:magnesium transporter n=1 Tax=unclassified Campylobacter TaxID=2593542 RepID=UPI0022EA0ADB|nr:MULTISPECIES: magnesium transporter [unclassified Campylobacter]MDA3056376.1 magnesium transporter [Campylobacter sp. CN_NA1]MDA3065493.1 magnesium transporter [Campylobacter sp. CN_NE4]MDA3068889.1 magnesium transporter [Campylobacter sp. CN_NE3]MDA3082946.1 magnesium transporter [Campylobacter sp. CN_EL2]MDA3084474.1 magnesium transporter [Campylobacter sp. CN_NE1]
MEAREFEEAREVLDSHIEETAEEEISSADLADHLKTLKKHDEEKYVEYLEKLDPEDLANVALEMPDHMLEDVIETIPHEKIVEAIEELESDDQAELFQNIEEIDEEKAKQIFEKLDEEDQKDILQISNYEDDEAGAYMQTEVFSAKTNETLKQAVDRLRNLKESGEIENVFQLFVLDESERLISAFSTSDLILYDFNLTLKEIIDKYDDEYKPHFATDTDKIDDVVRDFEEFDLSVMPVVDSNGVLIGRITSDDIHDIIQDRATEQIYHLAGVNDEAEEEDTLVKAGSSRAAWLFVNLCTAIVSSAIIGLFDSTIETIVALAILMPIVASMGGNTGTQALTVTVRRLALGEIEFKDKKNVLFREVAIAFTNGMIFAIIMGFVAYFWFGIKLLGVVIAMSMVINFTFAGIFGTVIPLTLKKFGIDPAVGSSVLLTTVTDIVGFFSFLGLATWILL